MKMLKGIEKPAEEHQQKRNEKTKCKTAINRDVHKWNRTSVGRQKEVQNVL